MSPELIVRNTGPGVTVQDTGRPGYLAFGVARGGAVDRLALAEGAALLGQAEGDAALEMAGVGGTFEATADLRIALTGALMRASIDGAPLIWNASHLLPKGARLSIGAAEAGVYAYLHVGGGIDTPLRLGARAAQPIVGIGAPIEAGDRLPVGVDPQPGRVGMVLEPMPRTGGGAVRLVPSLQTGFFSPEERARFERIPFRRDPRGNRMGVRVEPEGEGFHAEGGLSVLSEVIVPGDVQVAGDGAPFVLLAECQTTGGYPRIGTVLPADLPRVAQTRPGETLRFTFVTLDDALAIERAEAVRRAGLVAQVRPLVRRPEDIPDLLTRQLVGGVTRGDDLERNEP